MAASKLAALEFQAANRGDLKEKEDSQVAVLEEYAREVDTIGEEELRSVVATVVDRLRSETGRADVGPVLKMLLGHGGALEGKPVEQGLVATLAKEAVNSVSS